MSQQWIDRRVIEAPFAPTDAIGRLGRAVWLYLHLVRVANEFGLAMRTVARLHEELVVPEAEAQEWLARLEKAKVVRIDSREPFLVIKLPFWSGTVAPRAANAAQPSSSGADALEVPVGSSKQQPAAASKQSGEGGLGEGDALVAEISRVLDVSDLEEIRQTITGVPNEVVLKALLRVKMTPTSQIRKSKLALFRYLLTKFAANPHAH
jgi:hypothetical protein